MKPTRFSYAARCLVSGMAVVAAAAAPAAMAQHPAHSTMGKRTGMTAPSSSEFARQMQDSMTVMDRDMMAAPMVGDPDRDFAAMMIPHHRGAVDMAKAVLLHGKDPVLRRLAQEIIITQQQEIAVMQRRLTTLSGVWESAPSPRTSPAKLPAAPPPASLAVSGQDRVYTADQVSNTVSVIDPAQNKLLGIIRLGDPVPGALSPLYKGQLLVHGLGFSPDHRTLAAVSIGSNSVTLIDTQTNTVKGTIYVGRSPHEAFFTPGGNELWVAVRGEDYVSVIDPVKMREVRRIPTASGPGMVLFSPDGKYAFVPSSFVPELCVIDTKSYTVVARIKQSSPFSPNLAVSPDGDEVWFTLKDSGRTQIISARPPFQTLSTLDTGPITNHVTLLNNAQGKFAYVTIGGSNEVKVYRRGAKPALVATIPTGDLPHGIWPSGDGSRVYIGLENGDAVQAIDTATNKVLETIPVGQLPQALVYVPHAVPEGMGTANLLPLGEVGNAEHLTLVPPPGISSGRAAQGTVVVNALGLVDQLQVAVAGLQPGTDYQLYLVTSLAAPYGKREPLAKFRTTASGSGVAQAIGPLRQAIAVAGVMPASSAPRRYLIVSTGEMAAPELVQKAP
ncbi:MAG: DUF305 domain-containing protein [Armatimonadota bacterium]